MISYWQDFIFQPLGGFIIVFIGTLLLFAEVLVKGRFILAILGFLSISLYFMPYVQEGNALWMAALYLIGVLLVLLDGKFIGDGTIAAIGLISMLVALAIPSPSTLYGFSVVTGFILGALGSFFFMKILPRRQVWSKLTLKEALTSEKGYNSLNEKHKELIHKQGTAETDFRPTGTIRIGNEQYSAVSEGQWITKGTKLQVIEVSGTRILVTKIE